MPVTRETPTELTCSGCTRTSVMPEPGGYASMWDAGWRWRGAYDRPGIMKFVPRSFVFSCPGCPAVI